MPRQLACIVVARMQHVSRSSMQQWQCKEQQQEQQQCSRLTRACLRRVEFGGLMVWYFLCDRTPLFPQAEKVG
jgi:hypothetical protein